MNKPHQPQDNMIRMQELADIVGLQKTTIYNKIKQGTFPKPVQLSARAVAWRASDITAWQAALASGVRTEHAVGNVRNKEANTLTHKSGTIVLLLPDATVTLRVFDGEPEMAIANGGEFETFIRGRESLQSLGLALLKFI